MESISVREVLRRGACRVGSEEESVWGDLDSAMVGMTRILLEVLAESEVERRVGVRLHERGECRCDYRNGYRKRTVQTSYQVIEVRIPRLRGQGFVPSFLEPNHRAITQVEGWATKAFLSGLGRSDVIRLMESTTGCRPSNEVLRRVQTELDKRVVEFRERQLADRYEYLFLDAAWAKDIVGLNATRVCIMTAVGITYSGKKEILGFERTSVENEAGWRGFLSRLVSRGLKPSDLRLVISDEHCGLMNAVCEVFGDVPHQLCWAHRMRNVRKAVNVCDRGAVVAGLQDVYKASTLSSAKNALRRWRARWQEKYPNVVATVEEDAGHLLAFFACPELHWEYVRTSNPIERAFRELRRQQFGCGAFANRDACNRAVYRVFAWLNELWSDKNIWIPRIRKTKQLQRATK
jgi:putative transposase